MLRLKLPLIRRIQLLDLVPVVIIVLVPLVYWLSNGILTSGLPYQAYDPEYAYFLNSLAPFKGVGYAYMDHPGIPLEIVGTIALAATYPFVGSDRASFVDYHLHHPGLFLGMMHALLLIASIACALWFYFLAPRRRTWGGALAAASLALMFFGLQRFSFASLSLWSHHSFSFPLGTSLLLLLYAAASARREAQTATIVLVGLGIGLLSAIVVYFVTWLVGAVTALAVISWLRRRSARGTLFMVVGTGIAGAVGFVLGIVPVVHKLPRFLGWIAALTLHQGMYGMGAPGFSTASSLFGGLVLLTGWEPALFVTIALVFVLLLYAVWRWRGRARERPELWGLAAGGTIQLLAALLLVAKAPLPPYLLPVSAVLPVLLMVIWRIYEYSERLRGILEKLLATVFLAWTLFTLAGAIQVQRERVSNIVAANQQIALVTRDRASGSGNPQKSGAMIWAYGVFTPCNALMRGNNFIHVFNQEITAMCPNQYVVNDKFTAQPAAFAPDGQRTELNALAWDYIFTGESSLGLLTSVLQPTTVRVSYTGTKIGYMGFEPYESLLVLRRGE